MPNLLIYENGLRFLSKLYGIMVYAILGSDGLALASEDCFFNEQSLHDAPYIFIMWQMQACQNLSNLLSSREYPLFVCGALLLGLVRLTYFYR